MTALTTQIEMAQHLYNLHRQAERLRDEIRRIEKKGKQNQIVAGVIHSAAEAFEVAPNELLSQSQAERLAHARFVIANRLRGMGMTFQEIGKVLNRHHTTVMYMVKKYPDLYEYYPAFRERADKV